MEKWTVHNTLLNFNSGKKIHFRKFKNLKKKSDEKLMRNRNDYCA